MHLAEKGEGLVYGHIQYLRDVFALVAHIQGFSVIPFASTHVAGDIDIRQKVHFDLDDPIAATGLAPASLYVEAEASRLEASDLGIGGPGKEVPDVGKQARIGGRV
jgi:hypothetical protein